MDETNFDLKRYIPLIIIACLVVLAISVAFSVAGNGDNGKSAGQATEEPTTEPEAEDTSDVGNSTEYLGVVKAINTDLKTITLLNISNEIEQTLFYSGGTDITDKYNQIIAISQLQIGEIVDVYCDTEFSKVEKLQISNDAWEYKGVGNLEFNKSDKYLKISKSKFRYTSNLVIVDNGQPVSIIDINNKDELTVKGVGETTWSIIVTKGHGYIRFINYSDFIGGMVEVGYDIIVPIVDNMLIVAREGNYKLTLEKGDLKASININILRNRETIINLVQYQTPPEKVGTIDFFIEPYGADLTIDGKPYDYNFPIELAYGEYEIKVELGGYSSYTGVMEVNEPSKSIIIDLAEPESNSEDEEPDEDSTNTNTDDTEDGQNTINNGDNTDNSNNTTNNNSENSSTDNSNNTNNSSSNSSENSNTTTDNTNNSTTDNSQNSSSSTNSSQIGTTKTDEAHKIHVAAPIGTEVYLDGILKGTVPYSFTKEIGNHIISFRKDNYETKSYTVEVIDDNEDVTFSFPDLVRLD